MFIASILITTLLQLTLFTVPFLNINGPELTLIFCPLNRLEEPAKQTPFKCFLSVLISFSFIIAGKPFIPFTIFFVKGLMFIS